MRRSSASRFRPGPGSGPLPIVRYATAALDLVSAARIDSTIFPVAVIATFVRIAFLRKSTLFFVTFFVVVFGVTARQKPIYRNVRDFFGIDFCQVIRQRMQLTFFFDFNFLYSFAFLVFLIFLFLLFRFFFFRV
jgi:hypothetical protein